ncbi:hypothetical protein [Rhizocola hellebori]|nr:hypothetical protein [Rhizocola hellebori]
MRLTIPTARVLSSNVEEARYGRQLSGLHQSTAAAPATAKVVWPS